MSENENSTLFRVDPITGNLINPDRSVLNLSKYDTLQPFTGNASGLKAVSIPLTSLKGIQRLEIGISIISRVSPANITIELSDLTSSVRQYDGSSPNDQAGQSQIHEYVIGAKNDGTNIVITWLRSQYLNVGNNVYADTTTIAGYGISKVTAYREISLVDVYTKEEINPFIDVRSGSITGNVGSWDYNIFGKICILQLRWSNTSYTLSNNGVMITPAQLTAQGITPKATNTAPAGALNIYNANWGKMGTISVGNTGVLYGGDNFTGNIMGNTVFPIL